MIVTLPQRAARAAGVALLADNAAWVAERLAALPAPVVFTNGGTVLIDGVPHPIQHAPASRGGAWIEDGVLVAAGDPDFLARRVGDFLRAEARRRLAARVAEKTAQAGLTAKRITVKDTRSRWGSCTASGTLMFCWRLVMAPVFVQDYVVAHEVAHLRHLNHGTEFWALTDALSPHRQAAIAWLHEQGPTLLRTG